MLLADPTSPNTEEWWLVVDMAQWAENSAIYKEPMIRCKIGDTIWITPRTDVISQSSAEEIIRERSRVAENQSAIIWGKDLTANTAATLEARITGYISEASKPPLPAFGKLARELMFIDASATR
jgi:hypothetical protein